MTILQDVTTLQTGFLHRLQAMAASANALKQARNVLNVFSEYLVTAGVTEYDRISGDGFIRFLKDRKYKNSYVIQANVWARRFIRYLAESGLVPADKYLEFSTAGKKWDVLSDPHMTDYARYLKYDGFSERTILEYVKKCGNFINYLQELGLDCNQVRYKQAVEYIRELGLRTVKGKNLSRSTINYNISALRKYYTYLVQESKALQNPFDSVEKLRQEERIAFNTLTEKEMSKFLSSFDLSDPDQFICKVMCELLYCSGLRVSEMGSLKCRDVDYASGTVFIRDNKEKLPRKAVVCEYALELLRIYQDHVREKVLNDDELQDDYLFHNGGTQTFRKIINTRVKKQAKKIKLKKITTHSFRHSVGTQMFKNGADLREVQAVLGHKRINTTELYTRLTTEDMKKILKTAHPRERRLHKK